MATEARIIAENQRNANEVVLEDGIALPTNFGPKGYTDADGLEAGIDYRIVAETYDADTGEVYNRADDDTGPIVQLGTQVPSYNLPSSVEENLVLDMRVGYATVYTDESASTGATLGDEVRAWESQVGGITFTAAAGEGPILREDDTGLYLEFDGMRIMTASWTLLASSSSGICAASGLEVTGDSGQKYGGMIFDEGYLNGAGFGYGAGTQKAATYVAKDYNGDDQDDTYNTGETPTDVVGARLEFEGRTGGYLDTRTQASSIVDGTFGLSQLSSSELDEAQGSAIGWEARRANSTGGHFHGKLRSLQIVDTVVSLSDQQSWEKELGGLN